MSSETGSAAAVDTPMWIDPALEPALTEILAGTAPMDDIDPPVQELVQGRAVRVEDRVVPGPDGQPDITLAIFSPTETPVNAPCIYHTHGGGMMAGNRYTGMQTYGFLDWVEHDGLVIVSVEYRLAPAQSLSGARRGLLCGTQVDGEQRKGARHRPGSTPRHGRQRGGAMAAGISLLCRDRGGPALIGQLLACPMLDDRNNSVSATARRGHSRDLEPGDERHGVGALSRRSRRRGRRPFLRGTAREVDLAGLPPAFIDVGSAEVFRDESVDYASRIWAAGGQAELHVWAGGFHGYDAFTPEAAVTQGTKQARENWIRRVLGL